MANSNRPNYFLLLDIDPGARWTGAVFETRLRAKRSEWSKLVLNGVKNSRKVMDAQWAINHTDDIKRVMVDPVLREQEHADARRRLEDERERLRVAFEHDLRIMMSKGFLWDAERTALRRNYPDLLRDPDVAHRLDGMPTREFAQQHSVPEGLDQSKAVRIRSLLDSLGADSLYTLLAGVDPGVDARSPSERLAAAAKTLYQQTQLNMNKQDQKLVARQELAGHAMQVFGSAKDRGRYDTTLALAPVNALIKKYRSALAATERFEPGQVDRFLAEAKAVGAETKTALAMLLEHFKPTKWLVSLPAGSAEASEQDRTRCGACETWNDAENQFCVVCGVRLRITCPKCERTVPGHASCGQCGFPVGDYDWVSLLARECLELCEQQDLAGAEEKLATARQAWPSEGTDEPAVQLKRCREQVAGLRRQRAAQDESTARQLRTLAEQRNYHAVLNKATHAPATVQDHERFIREATEHIDDADRFCDLAERTASTSEQLDHYTQALARCADHKRAIRAVNALPPEPPRDLRAESTGTTIRLVWTPSSSDNVRYVVVRKSGAVPPASVADGLRLTTVRRTTYDDRTPETGLPLHYAVFAQRATGVASEHAAVTTEPVLVAGEVTITSQRVDDGVVELAWQLPIHAGGAVVQRTADGKTSDVETPEPTRLRDEGLVNGVSHTYTLRARYPAPDGADHRSAGVSVSLIPGRPPALPGPVHVRTVTRNLGLCYRLVDLLPQGAAPGAATILWTQQRPRIRAGEQYPVTELGRHGSLLTEAAAQGFALPRAGLYYFAQVVIQHGVGYVGEIRRYAAQDEVGELAARDLGDTVRLTWKWPDECTAALVTYDHDDWPPDPAVAPHSVLVDRVGIDRTGWLDVAGTTPDREQKFHFVVASASVEDGEVFVATGSRCAAELTPRKGGRRQPRRRKGR
ncbi:zinc ribbon domain-containing protein [Amycolatopsis sp. CA-126428]|uniref:zinc ribbon domain-containing protein n=1 Tax=Amycolatopsis sp. CA-126428 TaxID=2073158 RepID=UPI000CD1DD6F|nr:zinc ribbon domain-containing protein [Amycolatopsis sp. CA-126428]